MHGGVVSVKGGLMYAGGCTYEGGAPCVGIVLCMKGVHYMEGVVCTRGVICIQRGLYGIRILSLSKTWCHQDGQCHETARNTYRCDMRFWVLVVGCMQIGLLAVTLSSRELGSTNV